MSLQASPVLLARRPPSSPGTPKEASAPHHLPPPVAEERSSWLRTRDPSCWSPLEAKRAQSVPELPRVLTAQHLQLQQSSSEDGQEAPVDHQEWAAKRFPNLAPLRPLRVLAADGSVSSTSIDGGTSGPFRVGVASVSNAVAASGTHNVILGLRAFLDRPDFAGSTLWGIRNLSKGHEFEIDAEEFKHYLNQAGSDLLHYVPLNRVTERLLGQLADIAGRLALDGLLFLCGPSELPEVAKISEFFGKKGMHTAVVGVVHSLSGWVRLPGWINTNLGFDSASSVLAEIAGNISMSQQSIGRDAYHFVSCGSPTLSLEVAMQIRPTLCYLGDDVAERGLTLQAIVDEICDVIVARHHEYGLHSGVIMVSDDFFEKLVEMKLLRKELFKLRTEKPADIRTTESARQLLAPELGSFFAMLPADVCHSLVFRNDIYGEPLLKHQEPVERELGALVSRCLASRGARNEPTVRNLKQVPHSLRHIAMSPTPTPLDCTLGFALGHIAGVLVQQRATGYIASVCDAGVAPAEWEPCCVPLVRLLAPSASDGSSPAVVRRRLAGSADELFDLWRRFKDRWRYQQSYRQPGPVQYWGPSGRWTTYTLRVVSASGTGANGLAAELEKEQAEREAAQSFDVKLDRLFRLVRRRYAPLSPLQKLRLTYRPSLPQGLRGAIFIADDDRKGRVCADRAAVRAAFPFLSKSGATTAVLISSVTEKDPSLEDEIPIKRHASGELGSVKRDRLTPCGHVNPRVGIVLVGRIGPGVNNVVEGLFDYLKTVGGTVFCIVFGLAGLSEAHAFELTEDILGPYRNQGGSDLLGHTQPEDLLAKGGAFNAFAETARKLKLDGLVIWGGRVSHPWTARLAEYFLEHEVAASVVGVPASVQSDLPLVEQTLGFDTVCKLLSSIVGNLATQAASSGKLWCFVRIPGQSISFIAAEVTRQTHPHVVLFGDLEAEQLGIQEVTSMIADIVESRSKDDKNYGVVIIPDQMLMSLREMRQLVVEVSQILQERPEAVTGLDSANVAWDFGPILQLLAPISRALFQSFPERCRAQICAAIGAGGNLDYGSIETEAVFQSLVETELTRRVVLGTYKGPFTAISFSLPSSVRATLPTNFDCDLGYTLGYAAGIFVGYSRTGLLVDCSKLKEDVQDWVVGGTPLTSLLTFSAQQPAQKSIVWPSGYYIRPRQRLLYDVSTDGCSLLGIPAPRDRTLMNPGPAQFEGPCARLKTLSLCTPQLQRVRQMVMAEELITELKEKASTGCPPEVLQAVKMILKGGLSLLQTSTG